MLKPGLPEKLSTKRLILQRLRYEDAPEMFYAYASKPEATRFVSWATHRTIEDTLMFLRYAIPAWQRGKDYSFSIRLKESNILIGSIGIINDSGKVQFGYILSPSRWGNGYATEACKAILNELRKQDNILQLFTFVAKDNPASSRVLLKCGLVEDEELPNWFLFPNYRSEKQDCIRYVFPLGKHAPNKLKSKFEI
jgi:[ribosomal protein S5]-alanine N-acetyltransferase